MTYPKNAALGYTKADMDAVSNNPEWTAEDFARAKPFAEAFPDLAKSIRARGPQKAPKKVSTTLRLSPEVIEHFFEVLDMAIQRKAFLLRGWFRTIQAPVVPRDNPVMVS